VQAEKAASLIYAAARRAVVTIERRLCERAVTAV